MMSFQPASGWVLTQRVNWTGRTPDGEKQGAHMRGVQPRFSVPGAGDTGMGVTKALPAVRSLGGPPSEHVTAAQGTDSKLKS